MQPAFQEATKIALEAVGVQPVAARSSKNQRKAVKKEEARARKQAAKQAAERERAAMAALQRPENLVRRPSATDAVGTVPTTTTAATLAARGLACVVTKR